MRSFPATLYATILAAAGAENILTPIARQNNLRVVGLSLNREIADGSIRVNSHESVFRHLKRRRAKKGLFWTHMVYVQTSILFKRRLFDGILFTNRRLQKPASHRLSENFFFVQTSTFQHFSCLVLVLTQI
jgi:hypothetical protein